MTERHEYTHLIVEKKYPIGYVIINRPERRNTLIQTQGGTIEQLQQAFRDMKCILETRPIYHQRDDTIRGHVFCSFLALMMRKELERRLEAAGHDFEWAAVKQDLDALQETIIEEDGKRLALRSQCLGTCGSVFQAVGVAVPPVIREVG